MELCWNKVSWKSRQNSFIIMLFLSFVFNQKNAQNDLTLYCSNTSSFAFSYHLQISNNKSRKIKRVAIWCNRKFWIFDGLLHKKVKIKEKGESSVSVFPINCCFWINFMYMIFMTLSDRCKRKKYILIGICFFSSEVCLMKFKCFMSTGKNHCLSYAY